jgi:hypothetical protein
MYDEEYISTSDLNEIIYYEKLDADMEMAQLEAEGDRYWARMQKVEALLKEGNRSEAVQLCPHGAVCKLTGSCAEGDPRHMEEGYRCSECGAVVDEIGGRVIHDE